MRNTDPHIHAHPNPHPHPHTLPTVFNHTQNTDARTDNKGTNNGPFAKQKLRFSISGVDNSTAHLKRWCGDVVNPPDAAGDTRDRFRLMHLHSICKREIECPLGKSAILRKNRLAY